MKIKVTYCQNDYCVDLSNPIDISIPLISDARGPKCFYAPNFKISPYRSGDFVGSVALGAPVNFYNVILNPHGNGTHTECMGHISDKAYSINKLLKKFHFITRLITVRPEKVTNGDLVIRLDQVSSLSGMSKTNALIIRTFPNSEEKRSQDYSGKNPCYFDSEAIRFLVDLGVEHLLIDLPSVDREEDGGQLQAHKIFWNYPNEDRLHCTITEMVFVNDKIDDGLFFLNIQIPSFEMDAAPSKIVLYKLQME